MRRTRSWRPRSFAAQHQNTVAGQVKLVIVRCTPFIEADNPEILPLQFLESPYQVDHSGDAKVLGGSRAGLYRHRAQGAERRSVRMTPSTPAPSATRSRAPRFCGSSTPSRASSNRPAVDPGAGSNRSSMARNSCARTMATDPLVGSCSRHVRQLISRFLPDPNTGLPAFGDQPRHAFIVAFAGDDDMVESSPARAQRLFHRVNAVQDFHNE